MKRIGEPWIPGRVYRDRPGVYALIVGAEGLLCVVKDGELQLPGGGVDPGEQPIRALHREVWEETGWGLGGIRRFRAFQRFVWLPECRYWARKTQTVYLARAVRRLGPPGEAGHAPAWLDPVEASHRLHAAGDRWAAAEALDLGLIRTRIVGRRPGARSGRVISCEDPGIVNGVRSRRKWRPGA